MCENLQLMFAVFRIGIYSIFRRIFCMGPPPVKPNLTALCLGLKDSGKSTLLAVLSGEATDEIAPTVGFSIKALMFDDCFLDVKELGGGENVRPYWDRYYQGAQGVVFVVDSSADEDSTKTMTDEFTKVVNNEELDGLPLLVLANYQDRSGARSTAEISKILRLDDETGQRPWTIQACSASDKDSIQQGFQRFNKLLINPTQEGASQGDFHKI